MPRTASYGRPYKKYLRVGPADVAYIRDGEPGSPPVLFLHGITTNSMLWQKVLKHCGDTIDSVAIDLMGLGDTVISPYEDFSLASQADMVLDFVDRLGWDQFNLVGHDHGGGVAQIIAANHPDRISGLLLVDTISGDHWPIPLQRQGLRIARLPGAAELLRAAALVPSTRLGWRVATGPLGFASGYYDSMLLERDVIREYLRPYTDPDGRERARRFLMASDPQMTIEVLPKLRRFDRPCRILWGADDRFLSPSWGIQLGEAIPSAGFYLIPYCGHFAPDERPEVVGAHLLELVEGREAGSSPATASSVVSVAGR